MICSEFAKVNCERLQGGRESLGQSFFTVFRVATSSFLRDTFLYQRVFEFNILRDKVTISVQSSVLEKLLNKHPIIKYDPLVPVRNRLSCNRIAKS